ncbi:MAG: hypothetical protein AAF217_03435 [Pseudomonadota bacterium]
MTQEIHFENENLPMRAPEQVMRLERMGSFHQSRLSFMRVLLRRLKRENWQFDRPRFDLDENGVGVATYRVKGPQRTYTLVAFAHDLPDEMRSDRVIAEAWDTTFTLVDGEPSEEDISRLSQNVPLQEAGRISEHEFVLSRANRSVRLFDHVVDVLASGKQPDAEKIDATGYLMRTTAVYGSGKFGAADRSTWANREEFSGSFQPELLSVWLIRTFVIDLVEHLARMKGGDRAVRLDKPLRRRLGIGNSTGLGMAPFLINHPSLIHAWINARETALARVRLVAKIDDEIMQDFGQLVERAKINTENWSSEHALQVKKVADLLSDLTKLSEILKTELLTNPYPFNGLYEWGVKHLSLEGQEQLVSLMLEPFPDLVDELSQTMSADEGGQFRINGRMPLFELKDLVTEFYGWTNLIDFSSPEAIARVWYTSEEKLEPRLGERFEEPIEAYEQPLCPGRDARRLHSDLRKWQDGETVAAFLLKHPEHRHMVRRIQALTSNPYGEIRDNTIAAEMLPIDLLRCKLSFFGATKFDPRSDRWVRITMYQNAPYPDELAFIDPDDCAYPALTK